MGDDLLIEAFGLVLLRGNTVQESRLAQYEINSF